MSRNHFSYHFEGFAGAPFPTLGVHPLGCPRSPDSLTSGHQTPERNRPIWPLICLLATCWTTLLSAGSVLICHLQQETNLTAGGGSAIWVDVTTASNSFVAAPTNRSMFFRLASP